MKKLLLIIALFSMGNIFAQELEHLRPIPVTDISLVTHDTSSYKNPIAKRLCSYIDTSITFYECRNDRGVVGFLLDFHDNRPFRGYKSTWDQKSNSWRDIAICAGLKEVQRAEILLAKELDLKADSSQIIQRALTPPGFTNMFGNILSTEQRMATLVWKSTLQYQTNTTALTVIIMTLLMEAIHFGGQHSICPKKGFSGTTSTVLKSSQ